MKQPFGETLGAKLDRIRSIFESQRLSCVSYARDGASMAEIAEVEDFIGVPLPPSYRQFLESHNGFHVSGWQRIDGDPERLGCAQYSLTVCGTEEIKKFTTGLRQYTDGIDLEAIGEDLGIKNLRWRVERCINIGVMYDFHRRICFALDEPRENGEYALFEADVDECMNWLVWVVTSFPKIHVADSFEEFVDKALTFMIEHGTGFQYW